MIVKIRCLHSVQRGSFLKQSKKEMWTEVREIGKSEYVYTVIIGLGLILLLTQCKYRFVLYFGSKGTE